MRPQFKLKPYTVKLMVGDGEGHVLTGTVYAKTEAGAKRMVVDAIAHAVEAWEATPEELVALGAIGGKISHSVDDMIAPNPSYEPPRAPVVDAGEVRIECTLPRPATVAAEVAP